MEAEGFSNTVALIDTTRSYIQEDRTHHINYSEKLKSLSVEVNDSKRIRKTGKAKVKENIKSNRIFLGD
jgi:hypothetical protein